MARKIQWCGWRPDSLDPRDRVLTVAKPVVLPKSADLRAQMPPIYDQGSLGSCTANAIAAAVDFERAFQKEPFIGPSRLFIYFNERGMEGTVNEDAGAEIRDGIKSVARLGVCPESEWPYEIEAFAVKPTIPCYTDALKFRALSYSRVTQSASRVTQSAYYMRHCIGVLGKPVIFGFSVYEQFESDAAANTGIITLPPADAAPLGGHAVLAVGYDDSTQLFTVRNSWGSDWGQAGYFTMPYAYLLNPNLANDLWTVLIES